MSTNLQHSFRTSWSGIRRPTEPIAPLASSLLSDAFAFLSLAAIVVIIAYLWVR